MSKEKEFCIPLSNDLVMKVIVQTLEDKKDKDLPQLGNEQWKYFFLFLFLFVKELKNSGR